MLRVFKFLSWVLVSLMIHTILLFFNLSHWATGSRKAFNIWQYWSSRTGFMSTRPGCGMAAHHLQISETFASCSSLRWKGGLCSSYSPRIQGGPAAILRAAGLCQAAGVFPGAGRGRGVLHFWLNARKVGLQRACAGIMKVKHCAQGFSQMVNTQGL